MNQKIIILYANPWSLTDERTGQQRTGVSIQYINGESLTPVSGPNGTSGYQVVKQSIPADKLSSLRAVPGVYDATLTFQPRGGQQIVVVSDLKFVGSFE